MDPKNTDDGEIIEISLRELEPLLRSSLGEELILESYTTKEFLLPGENYGSTIMSVDAVIRRTENGEKENLHMIAKMVPRTKFQREIFKSSHTFWKEVSMYKTVNVAYRQLEKDHGINENELFDILPKYYGSRYSLDPEVDFDDDAVILLENLKHCGYYIGRREVGYDLDHSKLAVRAMARFHALGIAMRYKNPEMFEKLRVISKSIEINMEDFKDSNLPVLKCIKENPVTNEYYDRCAKLLTDEQLMTEWFTQPEGPWATIIHSDFWVNNIMFHKDQNGHVDDVKFVDFQNYVYSKPIRDLIFFLYSSTDDDVQANHIDELVDLYYDTFIAVLKRLDCDVTPFARENYNAQFPLDAKIEFVHLAFMIKVLTINIKEVDLSGINMKTVMTNYGGNDMFKNKLEKVILYFVEQNWI